MPILVLTLFACNLDRLVEMPPPPEHELSAVDEAAVLPDDELTIEVPQVERKELVSVPIEPTDLQGVRTKIPRGVSRAGRYGTLFDDVEEDPWEEIREVAEFEDGDSENDDGRGTRD